MANLQIGLEEIPYQLTRSEDYPFLKIYLDDLNGIYVSAPVRKTQQEIEGFLMKKKQWIDQKWKKLHNDLYKQTSPEEKTIMYLGRNYKVISYATEEPAASLLFNKGKFIFTYPSHYSTKDQETAFLQQEENWLKNRAEQKLKELTAISCEDNYRLGYKDKAAIYLNWRLIKRNKNQIQTIIDDLRNEKMY